MWPGRRSRPGAGRAAARGRDAAQPRGSQQQARSARRERARRAPADAAHSRPPVEALASSCRSAGVWRRRAHEAGRLEAGQRHHPPRGRWRGRPRGRAGELARPPRPARWRKPCWAIASPAVAPLAQPRPPASGLRWKNGWRSAAGITSSVTRSTPWSASQSRISAQCSNVAGSTSWMALRPRSQAATRLSSSRSRASVHPSPRRCSDRSQVRVRAAASPPRASRSRIRRERARPARAPASAWGSDAHSTPERPSCDQLGGAAGGDRHDRDAGGLRLEDHLAERVRARGEAEQVRLRVGRRQRVAVQPAEERRVGAEPLAQARLLRTAAGEHEVQAGVAHPAARNASASRSTPSRG